MCYQPLPENKLDKIRRNERKTGQQGAEYVQHEGGRGKVCNTAVLQKQLLTKWNTQRSCYREVLLQLCLVLL